MSFGDYVDVVSVDFTSELEENKSAHSAVPRMPTSLIGENYKDGRDGGKDTMKLGGFCVAAKICDKNNRPMKHEKKWLLLLQTN